MLKQHGEVLFLKKRHQHLQHILRAMLKSFPRQRHISIGKESGGYLVNGVDDIVEGCHDSDGVFIHKSAGIFLQKRIFPLVHALNILCERSHNLC